MSDSLTLLASTARGCGDLLARELAALGADEVRERGARVAFKGDLALAYRACLETRVASRIFLELASFEAGDANAFYAAARRIDWPAHVAPDATIACEFSGQHPAFTNTQFGALRLKDAVVDSLLDATGRRPDVARERPDVRLHAHAISQRITVSIDLSGEGLHRRGYRGATGEAPVRETLAASILQRVGWPEFAARGAPLLDPLCGSGTLVIEAALMAADIAPGLQRDYYGFMGWRQHDAAIWHRLCDAARQRAAAGLARCREQAAELGVLLRGRDHDARAIAQAQGHAVRAGVADIVAFEVGELGDARPHGMRDHASGDADGGHSAAPAGLLVTNPPYGERLGEIAAARAVHAALGLVLREHFSGWRAALITSSELGLELGLRASRTYTLFNGPIECRLLRIDVGAAAVRDLRPSPDRAPKAELATSSGAVMFANRIAKNLKRLKAWRVREKIFCYRLYDSDMPEYALAIDEYANPDKQQRWLYVQEYAAPADIPEEDVRRRRSEALAALPGATGIATDHIFLRTRRRTTRGDQYGKHNETGQFDVVEEGGLKFWVNFNDYQDTGIFIDHRIVRDRLRQQSAQRRFLNLFAYTGSATVYAAAGGARETTTVDLSNTYLEWAQRNMRLNGFAGREHQYIQADCREWLRFAVPRGTAQYDVIFLDPPTFSNSKRMQGVLDTERDHAVLIDQCMALLAPEGLLVFSTNAQRFKLDATLADRYRVNDVSRTTLPPDFGRNARIHQCFEFRTGHATTSPGS